VVTSWGTVTSLRHVKVALTSPSTCDAALTGLVICWWNVCSSVMKILLLSFLFVQWYFAHSVLEPFILVVQVEKFTLWHTNCQYLGSVCPKCCGKLVSPYLRGPSWKWWRGLAQGHYSVRCLPTNPLCRLIDTSGIQESCSKTWSQFNWNCLFKKKKELELKNLELKFPEKDSQINLPFNFLIQKYFFRDNPAWNIN